MKKGRKAMKLTDESWQHESCLYCERIAELERELTALKEGK